MGFNIVYDIGLMMAVVQAKHVLQLTYNFVIYLR